MAIAEGPCEENGLGTTDGSKCHKQLGEIATDPEAHNLHDQSGWFKVRYVVATLCFFSFVFNYALRININIAIVEMVNPYPAGHLVVVRSHDMDQHNEATSWAGEIVETTTEFSSAVTETAQNSSTSLPTDECGRPPPSKNSTTAAYDPNKFDWDEQTQSLILSSVFFGYITTQFIGGRLGEIVGAKLVLGVPLFICAMLSMLTPMAAKGLGYGAVIAVRILIGMCEGVAYPATHALMAHWAPPLERSKMSSFIYAGAQIGTIVTLAPAGLLISAWGWESMFYFFGLITMVWFVFWMLLVANKPSEHKLISEAERKFIDASLICSEQKSGKPSPPLPWHAILTSVPFWALLVSHAGNNFGKWIMLAQLPTYMKNILHFEIQANGFLSALPFVAMFISAQIYGNVVDVLRSKNLVSTTTVRKVSNFIAQAGSGLCFVAVAYTGCDQALSVAFFTLGEFFQGAVYSGYMTNHLDLAPNFAGSLMGLTNTAATVTSWAAPVMTGAIINKNQTIKAWRTVFWISAAIMIFDAIEYLIFADGREQKWNQPEKQGTSSISEDTETTVNEDRTPEMISVIELCESRKVSRCSMK